MSDVPLVQVDGLTRAYRSGGATIRAVDSVSLSMPHGRSLGIVGESGSGKSTLARLVMALDRPDSGVVRFRGDDLFALSAHDLRARRRHFQMVFQDPYGSLDPRQRVARIIAEPLDVAKPALSTAEKRARVVAMLDAVGLPSGAADHFPHEFSGGQRQRIALARALITAPELIVADEPVSALDVSIQAQILNLMMDLQEQRGVAFLFISHNLAVVEHIADDVAVMYRGRIVEQGPASALFEHPAHPYTQALIDAVPDPHDIVTRTSPALGDEGASAQGCAYASRCPHAQSLCRETPPALRDVAPDRKAACHFPRD